MRTISGSVGVGVTHVYVCGDGDGGVVLRQSSRACSSISGDVWLAHIAVDGTQYVRSRKAITIRFRENCPIPNDTTGKYRENLYRSYSLSLLRHSIPLLRENGHPPLPTTRVSGGHCRARPVFWKKANFHIPLECPLRSLTELRNAYGDVIIYAQMCPRT
ncbi:hypothetical protein CBL_05534 [Carabus blaptoides fortunei]